MGREIKFRGLNIDKWVYGGYFKNSEEDGLYNYIFDSIYGAIQVKPKSIGQFTGLKDKNGVDIYEGDILTGGIKRENCIVSYDGHCGRFIANSENYKVLGHRFRLFKVIGNIHENPELLKN